MMLQPSHWLLLKEVTLYYTKSRLTAFYQSYGPLSVLAILSTEIRLHNSSYIFQGILMKLSRYCFHDLKRIILYQGLA